MKIEKKQLILLIVTFCALGFLIWQIVRLINDNLSEKKQMRYSLTETPELIVPPKKSLVMEAEKTPASKNNPYVNLIDQYQLLQMQHKLLSEELMIAKLRTEIEKLNQQNEPSARSPEVQLNNNDKNPTPYQLVYLAKQNQNWTATLLHNNQYQTVSPGDTLADGSKIIRINDTGVLLENSAGKMLLDFKGVHATPTTTASTTTMPATHEPATVLVNTKAPAYAPSTASNHAYQLDEILLLELPPSDYTIELKKTASLSSLKKLIAQFELNPRAMLFHLEQHQKTHFVLLLGSYSSENKARATLSKLPKALRALNPEVVSVSTIQQMIKSK